MNNSCKNYKIAMDHLRMLDVFSCSPFLKDTRVNGHSQGIGIFVNISILAIIIRPFL